MATYGFLDMFLSFSLFAITSCAVVCLIFYWKPLFTEVRDHCHYGIAHPMHARLLWLVSLTIASWFLAVVAYSRNVSAIWNMTKTLKLEDRGKGSAFTLTQTYFFVLLVCSLLAFMFTAWFSYHVLCEFPSLIKIIRFHAVKSHSDDDLENGRNDQWEMGTAHSEEDDQAGSVDSNPTTEDEYDPYDGYYLCNEDHRHGWTCEKDWNRYQNERKAEYDNWPASVEVVDNDGKGDNVPEEDEQVPDHWCYLCRKFHTHGWLCSHNEDEDQHNSSHSTKEDDGFRLTPSSSGSDAEANTSTARPPKFDNWYAAPDDTQSCASCDSESTKDIPWTKPAAHREPLSPISPAAPLPPFASHADDSEELDISDNATIESPEGTKSKTWNNEARDVSHDATLVHVLQSEHENTGPLNNMQEPNDQTTNVQEQRPRPTNETGHSQGPPVGAFRHGITRPLRLMIPTESFGSGEPRAPTTPVNTHSPVEWPVVENTRSGW